MASEGSPAAQETRRPALEEAIKENICKQRTSGAYLIDLVEMRQSLGHVNTNEQEAYAQKKKRKRERGENVNFAVRSFPPWMDDHLGVNSDPLWEVGQ